MIGYCWGGGTTFMHAVNGGAPGFAGGVAFYGLPYMNGAVPIADSLAKIKVPVMLFNGAKDARIGAAMPAVDSAMKRARQDVHEHELRWRDARIHALAGRPEGDARSRRGSGEPRGDEGRVAENGRVPQAESRNAMTHMSRAVLGVVAALAALGSDPSFAAAQAGVGGSRVHRQCARTRR